MDSNYIINIISDVKYFMKLRRKRERGGGEEKETEKENEIKKLKTCKLSTCNYKRDKSFISFLTIYNGNVIQYGYSIQQCERI